MGKGKPRVTHWGYRDGDIHALCGKHGGSISDFREYGRVTTIDSDVDCKNCLAELKQKSGWYCQHCKAWLQPIQVKFDETCDTCGMPVLWLDNVDIETFNDLQTTVTELMSMVESSFIAGYQAHTKGNAGLSWNQIGKSHKLAVNAWGKSITFNNLNRMKGG